MAPITSAESSTPIVSDPLVSVITCFRDQERFLQEAIESVLAQTYTRWELILIDDGSTDGSSQIAESYALRFPHRIQYLEHEGHANHGTSASRNLGLARACGQLIAFLDGDDVWLPPRLEQHVEILTSLSQVGMVYGPTLFWNSWSSRYDGNTADYHDFQKSFGVPLNQPVGPPTLLKLLFTIGAAVPCICSVTVRRTVLNAIGGFETAFTGLYDDQALYTKLYLNCIVFVSLSCCALYRRHPLSMCAAAESQSALQSARLVFLHWVRDYLSQQNVADPEVWRAHCKAMLPYNHPFLFLFHPANLRQKLRSLLARLSRIRNSVRFLQCFSNPTESPFRRNAPRPISFEGLRRVTPFSRDFGRDRGRSIDSYYIERFLAARAVDVRGTVLEIKGDDLARRFGGDRVTRRDVLDVDPGNPNATILADLTRADHVPSDAFDCVICTHTLPLIYDVRAALNTLCRILKPGGVLLVTAPGVSQQISRRDRVRGGDYWRFTTRSLRQLFQEFFPPQNVNVEAQGNVLAATALLYGLTVEELSPDELDFSDPDYEVCITVRTVKPI